MPFFPNEPRRGPMPPVYRQSFGPPNQMRRQPPQFYGPQPRPNFFMLNPQRQQMFNENRQPSNFFGPNQQQPNFNPYSMQQPLNNQQNQGLFQQQQQQQQQPQSPLGRIPDTINTLMGHAGTIQNGVNMMRQLGSFLGLFR